METVIEVNLGIPNMQVRQYANRSIPADDHRALTRDPDWRMTPLI
jgi:hypothetical protein